MAQTTFVRMTQTGLNKIAAALASETVIDLVEMAIGDGATVPSGAETALYNEVDRKTISGQGIVAGAANTLYAEIYLGPDDGPYTISEFGVFDSEGDMIAIGRFDPPINKPTAEGGQVAEGVIRANIAFSDATVINITVDASMQVALQRLSNLPWIPVLSAEATAPPPGPVIGDTYVIPAGAAGSWATHDQKVAEYTAAGWAIIEPKDGHGVGLPDGRQFRRVNGVYREYRYTESIPAAGVTLYVRLDGNDANDGSLNTAAGAFRTVGAAMAFAQRYGGAGKPITIRLGQTGEYLAPQSFPPGSRFKIMGNGGGASSSGYVLINTDMPRGLVTGSQMVIELADLTLKNSQVGYYTLRADSGASVILSGTVVLDATINTARPLCGTTNGGVIRMLGTVTVASSGASALHADAGNIAIENNAIINFQALPVYSDATAVAQNGGSIVLGSGATRNGGSTGKRYRSDLNGVINTNGGGINFFPGDVAGTTANGGVYV